MTTDPDLVVSGAPAAADAKVERTYTMKAVLVGLVGLIAGVVIALVATADSVEGERTDFAGQGGDGPVLAEDGAMLVRGPDGVVATADVPTPEPGKYDYPTSTDVLPGGSHPEVLVGSDDAPEVFTMWLFVFNNPEGCTDDACGPDDLGADTVARGGVHQVAGRIADGDRLVLSGTVRLGQASANINHAPLDDPLGAEIHLAIAPHGKALGGDDLRRQLNGPLGNPSFWWAASFFPEG